jgi:hypothetical protein
MTFDQPGDLVPIVVIITGILAGILWMIRAQNAMSRQFRPNHGHSMRDSIDRIEKDTRDLRYRLDHHIDDHNK